MKKIIDKWYHPAEVTGSEYGKNRYYYLDNLKFALILLVVIGHFSLKMKNVNAITYFQYFIYIFHMPCFVFTSGYLAKRMNEGGKLRADKILGVFWMYFLFKIGNVLLLAAFDKPVRLNILKDTAAPWYLLALGIWYLLVPMLERIKPAYLIEGTFLFGIAAGYTESIGSILSLSRVIVFLPFFALGFCFSGKLDAFLNKKLRILALLILVTVLAGIVLLWKYLKPFADIVYGASPYKKVLGEYALYGLLIRGIWYLLAVITSAAFMLLVPRCKMLFSVLGERTLQVYMTHIWIRNALLYAGFFSFLNKEPGYISALVLLGCVALTFLLANRWIKKVFDFLAAPGFFKKLLN